MLRITAGGVFGLESLRIAQAAYHANYSGFISLEAGNDRAQIQKLLDAMVLSHCEFSAFVDKVSAELVDLLGNYHVRGLKEVIFPTSATADLNATISDFRTRGIACLVQVHSLDEALAAEKAGADALVVKGSDSTETTTHVLLQKIGGEVSIPFYARGGIGIHTVGACLVAGASGVVLDWQLALSEESDLADDIKTRVAGMVGLRTETAGPNAIGPDAALAAGLASEYRTVKGICDAIRMEGFRHLRTARRVNPIREGGPLAESQGTRYPVLRQQEAREYVHVSSDKEFRMLASKGKRKFIFEGSESRKEESRQSFVVWDLMTQSLLSQLSSTSDRPSDFHVLYGGGIDDGLAAAMVSAVAAPLAEKGVRAGILIAQDSAGVEETITNEAGELLDVAGERLYDAQIAHLSETSPDLRPSVDIAIVGMSCVFPKADDLKTYWQNILNKVNAIGEIPKDRWNVDLYFDKNRRAVDKIYSRWGGFIGPVVFDPARYGMPPNSVSSVDPLQLLMLELTNRALADAGYNVQPFDRENTSVIVGVGGGTGELGLGYGFRSLLPHFLTHAGGDVSDAKQMIEDCEHILPSWTEDSFAGLLLNVVAGRVANRLDLGGTNYSVDAACATALAAVRLAVTELESRSSNVVVAAGVDTMNTPFSYLCFSKTQALSPTGQCRTFDETADGIVISEGVAIAICKRLEDAIRDGDRIYSIIKSVGASSDGKDKGLTAPRPIGQMRALERAYTKAGIPANTVGLVEAHGTGTVVGDRTEVESVTRFFEGAGTPKQSCAMGSVKSMIGHTKCTAGMAGLVKAALSLQHGVLPATMGVTKPNSKANFGNSPLYINTETRPWIKRIDGTPRRAGVSAFGFGGTNFHTVMEEPPEMEMWPEPNHASSDWPAELFLWKADSNANLLRALDQLATSLENGAEPVLCDLAAAVCWEHGTGSGSKCLAVVATSLPDLQTKIDIAKSALAKDETNFKDPRGVYFSAEPLAKDGKIAFLFPGQGSQRPDMLCDLAVALPAVRKVFEQADVSLGTDKLGKPLSSFIFPLPTFTEEEKKANENAIKQTNVAQPSVGAADLAAYRLLSSIGVHPDMVAGHSYGEFVALCAAGSISFDDLIRVSEARGRFIIEAATTELGTMAAVDADESVVAPVVAGIPGVVIANLNSPLQTVISGTNAGIAEAVKRFIEQNINAREIAVACAFHSPLVSGAMPRLEEMLESLRISSPTIPVFSNTTAAPHSADPNAIRSLLCEHLAKPVRFVDELKAMYDAGARVFVEVGPGKVLTGLAERTLSGRRIATITFDPPGRHGLLNLVHSLGSLAVAGVSFHAHHLFEGRITRKLDLARLVEETKPQQLSPTSWIIEDGRALPAKKTDALAAASQKKQQPTKTWQPAIAPVVGATPVAPPAASASTTLPAPAPVATVPAVELPKPAAAAPVALRPAMPATVAPPVPRTAAPQRQNVPAVKASGATISVPQTAASRAMAGHNALMAKFLETQKNLMLAYLQGQRPATRGQIVQPAIQKTEAQAVIAPAPAKQAVAAPAPIAAAPPAAAVAAQPVVQAKPVVVQEIRKADQTVSVAALAAATTAPAAAPEVATPAPAAAKENIIERLINLVSERTGYPPEMLGLDLDLEADLGVDSIKRVEILSALQTASTSMGSVEGAIEELTKLKTLRAIAQWIESKVAQDTVSGEQKPEIPAPAASKAVPAPEVATGPAKQTTDFSVSRMLVKAVEVPLKADCEAARLQGLVLITDDGSVAGILAEKLNRKGVATRILPAKSLSDYDAVANTVDEIRRGHGRISTVVHLLPLVESRGLNPLAWAKRIDTDLKSLYNLVRSLETDLRKEDGSGRVLTATRMGGSFAISSASPNSNGKNHADFCPGNAAVCGFIKSVAREWAEVSCRAVDFEFDAGAEAIADALISELNSPKGLPEVSYQHGVRKTLQSVLTPLVQNGTRLEMQPDSVVLITGGARGITASIAVELAKNFQCKLILAGRSSLPGPESPLTAGVTDPKQVKTVLLKQATERGEAFTPASIEAAYRKLFQEREIRSSLAAMSAVGSTVEYHSVDVTDDAAMGALIEDVYRRYGKIDGVIHGAGIIEDKLLRDKTPASFERVIRPKLLGAFSLMARLRPESLRFLVFFSSVSARYGNRGQCDYAAANEVLDKLAWWLNARWPARVLSINWGPWKTENGMVSSALASQFAKAGVQLIDPTDGQKIFVSELLFGKKEDAEVVWGGPIFTSAEAASTARTGVVSSSLPLLANRTEFRQNPDGSLLVVRETTPAVDLYLEHHKLDGKPVLPMAMVLELFAEVAAAKNPNRQVLQVRDLRRLRGVVFDQDGPQVLRVQASDAADGSVDLKLETAGGRGLCYSAKVEIVDSYPRSEMRPGLRLERSTTLALSLPEIYENWLFHGPSFAGIEHIEGIGENGIVAELKPSLPSELFSYRPREKWLIDPVIIDSGLQLLIVWARHFLDTTPLPSKVGICHVFGQPSSDKVRCEIKVHHQPGSQTLRSDLRFFDEANRMFARLEDMEVTLSKALNRLGGAVATAGGTYK